MGTVILTLFIFLLALGTLAFLVLHKVAKKVNAHVDAIEERARIEAEANRKRIEEQEEENRKVQELMEERRRRRQEEIKKAQELAAREAFERRKLAQEEAKIAQERAKATLEAQTVENEIKNSRYSVYGENSPIKRRKKST